MTGDRYFHALRVFHRTQRPGDTLVRPSAAPVQVLPTRLTQQFNEARRTSYALGQRDAHLPAWRWGFVCGACWAVVLAGCALGAAAAAGLLQWAV